jgi:hypothetical protein
MADKPANPKIEDAPGLVWRRHKHTLEARWQARSDLVERGYPISVWPLWKGRYEDGPPDAIAVARIQDVCNALQNEMLVWGAGGIPVVEFDGTVRGLIGAYKTDSLSGYQKLRHHSRINYNCLLKRLDDTIGDLSIASIKARTIHQYYQQWVEGGKVPMAHSLMTMLRTITSFGMAFLEDEECTRVSVILNKLRFENGKARTVRLQSDQVLALRAAAHAAGFHSIALANAFQFDGILRQKDVIGEWVPLSEPGVLSDVHSGNQKWGRGILWSEIDDTLTLHHVTSKKQKPVHIPLRLAPSVMEEFCRIAGVASPADLTRDKLPQTGPVIVCETTHRPWSPFTFRITWRELATSVGIPKNVRNMDSRAGAISEAVEAGAPLEHVRHAATHSDMATTQRYDRAGESNTINVMELRQKHRNKSGT